MALFFKAEEFWESLGGAQASFAEQLRDGVVNFTCDLWFGFPDFITNASNPVSSFHRGYMNSICEPVAKNVPAPQSAFIGGQCCDKSYRVVAQVQETTFNGGAPYFILSQFFVVGKVNGLSTNEPPPGFSNLLQVIQENCGGTLFYTRFFDLSDINGNPTGVSREPFVPEIVAFSIANVLIAAGQVDDCGNPPVEYPPATPGPGDLTTTFNITVNDGLDLPVTVNYNSINANFNFPIQVDIGGLTGVLDLSGLTITNNFVFEFPGVEQTYPPLPNGDAAPILDFPCPNDTGQPPIPAECDLTPVLERTCDIENAVYRVEKVVDPEPIGSGSLTPVTTPVTNGIEVTGLSNLKWLRCNIVNLPPSRKIYFANQGEPRRVWWGWISFLLDNKPSNVILLTTEEQVVQAPPGATGFFFTASNQATGQITYYTFTPDEPCTTP